MAANPPASFTALVDQFYDGQDPNVNIIAGRGYVAKQEIAPGTLILTESPFFRLCAGDFAVPASVHQDPRWLQLQGRPAPGVTFGHGAAYDRFMTNRMRCGVYSLPGGQQPVVSGIFLRASIFNASCEPNVHAHWNQSTQHMEFRTMCQIAPREELCICYNVNTALLCTRQERRSTLLADYRFDCTCAACQHHIPESDTRRTAIGETVRRGGSIQDIRDALVDLQEERLYHFEDTLLYDLHTSYASAGGHNNAMLSLQALQGAYNVARGRVGNVDDRVLHMRGVLDRHGIP